jgi:hypothetical protein
MMPLAWDAAGARLSDAATGEALADYRTTPQSLVMWSAPTPAEGVTGELLCFERGTPDEIERQDVRGKILFTPRHPTEIKAAAARAGALGIVSDWTKTGSQPGVRQWINTWSDDPGGWVMHGKDHRLWGFTLTPRQGESLRHRARQAVSPLRLHAAVDTRLYSGEPHYVSAALAGESPEELLLTAHINEQGGNDNAAGAASLLESARVLSDAVRTGTLRRPRRTLRFLLMPESYGTMAYAVQQRERLARTRAALNVDSGAGSYEHEDAVLELFVNPHCCPNPFDAASWGIASAYYRQIGRPDKLRLKRYNLAGDNCFCDPLLGVPHPWLAMGDGGDLWHNTADTPDRVDPRSLHDLCCVVGGIAAFLANASDDEVRTLAAESREALAPSLRPLLRFPSDSEAAIPAEFEGSNLVFQRSVPGALTLDGIPPNRWGPISSSPRWWGPHLAAWWWIDGRRSLGEIACRLIREFGAYPSDLPEFFATLRELGYVRSTT